MSSTGQVQLSLGSLKFRSSLILPLCAGNETMEVAAQAPVKKRK